MEESIEELREKNRKEMDNLLEKIKLREEMVGLLKIAKPEKIADIRVTVSQIDKSIEATEKIIALSNEAIRSKGEYTGQTEILSEMSEKILEGMREHFADDPEKLELLEAMLENDGKNH